MELPLEVDHAMLMITVEIDPAQVTLRLEGQLSLPEVRELARTRDTAAFERPDCRLSIDVTHVVEIDRHGREFLAHMQRHGDCIVGSGATRASVDALFAADAGSAPASERLTARPVSAGHPRP